MFEFNEKEFKDYVLEKDYMTDPKYDENLNITQELKISKKESEEGAEREIKIKQNLLVCKKRCKKCKKETDKIYNLLKNNCGELKKVNSIEKVKIPKGVKDEQTIVLVGKGQREKGKYGNLAVTLKIK